MTHKLIHLFGSLLITISLFSGVIQVMTGGV